ncbi:MAG: hypothetical protein ACLT33_05050 [Lachnospira pectinoschiza]
MKDIPSGKMLIPAIATKALIMPLTFSIAKLWYLTTAAHQIPEEEEVLQPSYMSLPFFKAFYLLPAHCFKALVRLSSVLLKDS